VLVLCHFPPLDRFEKSGALRDLQEEEILSGGIVHHEGVQYDGHVDPRQKDQTLHQ